MNIRSEKIELARLILAMENESVILKIKDIILESTPDWWDELPENVKRNVLADGKEIDEGKGIPHEEVLKKYA